MALNLSGFRMDASKLRRKLAQAKREIRADAFKPELLDFVRKSLATAARTTPVRDYQTIRSAQSRQYANRINYIPSVHTLEDPSLRVKNGVYWLYYRDKWYRANEWKLPVDAQASYANLLAERERRLETERAAFIAERAQARYLYRKSWSQVAASLGLSIPVSAGVEQAHSRHNPPHEPPKGYGQLRGGKVVLSVVIYNPFLAQESRYKQFNGSAIIGAAMDRHRPHFDKVVARKLERILYSIFNR